MCTPIKKHCNRDLSPPCRGLRYRGVGERVCSASFRLEFFSETQSLEGLSTTDRRCASVLSTDGSVPTCLAHAGASSWKGPIDGEKPLGSQPHLSPFARGPCIARRSPVPGSVCCPRL